MKIDSQNTVGGQGLPAAFIKLLGAQFRRLALVVVAIHQKHIQRAFDAMDILRTIGLNDSEQVAVLGNMEFIAQGDNVRVDLNGDEIRLRKDMATELGQATATQTNHGNTSRMPVQNDEAHHGFRVGQFQLNGMADAHAALQFIDREVQ